MPSDRLPPHFPAFANVEDERRHRKQRLAAALRLFGQFGFDKGSPATSPTGTPSAVTTSGSTPSGWASGSSG